MLELNIYCMYGGVEMNACISHSSIRTALAHDVVLLRPFLQYQTECRRGLGDLLVQSGLKKLADEQIEAVS